MLAMPLEPTDPKKKPRAKYRLTDADVREVSTVDRPAIAEPFLIVKSAGGRGVPLSDSMSDKIKNARAELGKAIATHTASKSALEKAVTALKAVDPTFTGEMDPATGQPIFGDPPVAGAPNPSGATADEIAPGAIAKTDTSRPYVRTGASCIELCGDQDWLAGR